VSRRTPRYRDGVAVAFGSEAIAAAGSRASWASTVPGLIAELCGSWRLADPRPLGDGVAGAVFDVRRADGSAAVLKLGFPHVEGVDEAVVLELLGPALAPAVLAQDPTRWAMLLERVDPGTPLSAAGLEAVDAARIAGGLLARMRVLRPPRGLPTVADQYGRFVARFDAALGGVSDLAGRTGADIALLAGTAEEFGRLVDERASGAAPGGLLHGDANPGNVLRARSDAGRGPWRLIDPKPLVGDAAFDLVPLVRDLAGPGASPARVALVLTAAADAAGVDPRRAARWGRVRTALDVLWSTEDRLDDRAREAARLLPIWRDLGEPPGPSGP